MNDNSFENFLAEKHAKQYAGLDDDMSDDFNDWLEKLDQHEIIDWAEEWHVKEHIFRKE